MNIQQFLEHHGIRRNPFAEEDAQTDPVFKDHCIHSAYHPVWDKVYGQPEEPSTSIVFGPKGSGKTAMRLQIQTHLDGYNKQHPEHRVFVLGYDDFNPFLDHFAERLSRRRARSAERVLESWRLWDHIDAMLSLATTKIADDILGRDTDGSSRVRKEDLKALDRAELRDLLLLAACYDASTDQTPKGRWTSLRRTLGFKNWYVGWDMALGIVWTILAIALCVALYDQDNVTLRTAVILAPLLALVGWLPRLWRLLRCQRLAMGIRRHLRVGNRDVSTLRKLLMQFPTSDLAGQPLPRYERTDDRYALLGKLQGLLRRMGFGGIIVLIDRVDEPQLIGGRAELMQRLVWPLLDNKLLKHTGLGLKLMLPRELYRYIERENREFHERARMDKQNVIADFSWTGQALYDVAYARIRACSENGQAAEPKDLFDESVSFPRLLSAMESLQVPRHLFRCFYRMLVDHCNKYTDADPHYKIEADTFERVLAVYTREMASADG